MTAYIYACGYIYIWISACPHHTHTLTHPCAPTHQASVCPMHKQLDTHAPAHSQASLHMRLHMYISAYHTLVYLCLHSHVPVVSLHIHITYPNICIPTHTYTQANKTHFFPTNLHPTFQQEFLRLPGCTRCKQRRSFKSISSLQH